MGLFLETLTPTRLAPGEMRSNRKEEMVPRAARFFAHPAPCPRLRGSMENRKQWASLEPSNEVPPENTPWREAKE